MLEQVPDRDRRAEVVQLRQVFADVVVQRQLAVLLQEQDGERGELLGDGRDVKDCVGTDAGALFEVGQAVRLLVDQFPVAHHADGTPGRCLGVPAGEHLVHAVGQLIRPPRGDPNTTSIGSRHRHRRFIRYSEQMGRSSFSTSARRSRDTVLGRSFSALLFNRGLDVVEVLQRAFFLIMPLSMNLIKNPISFARKPSGLDSWVIVSTLPLSCSEMLKVQM